MVETVVIIGIFNAIPHLKHSEGFVRYYLGLLLNNVRPFNLNSRFMQKPFEYIFKTL